MKLVLLDAFVDSLLKTGYTICDSKWNSGKPIEFTINFKCHVEFILTLDGYLMVDTFWVQRTIVFKV